MNRFERPDLYHADCMEALKEFPDQFFDLAIVDPPYGIGIFSMNYTRSGAVRVHGKNVATRNDYRRVSDWDIKPGKEYFDELFRVSKKQIIWGGNYFSDLLPPSKGFIIWDKRCSDNMKNDFADCEYAWMSAGLGVARIFRFLWNGMLQGNMKDKEERFHPTQKPVALYLWLLDKYAKKGDKILDTHAGSAASLIACQRSGFDGWGFEIDDEYFEKARARLDQEKNQINIYDLI